MLQPDLPALVRDVAQHAGKGSVAVGLSGGVDSMALLLACHQAQLPCIVIHINHQLQRQAAQWVQFCADVCARLGMQFESRCVTVIRPGGDSLEACARIERYLAIAQVMQTRGCRLLLTAHHADDQLETVLIQLFRGSGMAGLAGMAAVGKWPSIPAINAGEYADLQIARPFLTVPKQALVDFVRDQGHTHIEDPSNADGSYRRNFLRNDIIPKLREAFPQIDPSIQRLARQVGTLKNEWAQEAEWHLGQLCRADGALDGKAWRLLNEPVRRRILRAWLARYGIGVDERQTIELEAQLLSQRGGLRRVSAHAAVLVKSSWFYAG